MMKKAIIMTNDKKTTMMATFGKLNKDKFAKSNVSKPALTKRQRTTFAKPSVAPTRPKSKTNADVEPVNGSTSFPYTSCLPEVKDGPILHSATLLSTISYEFCPSIIFNR